MRYSNYLKEDSITKALNLEEPKIGSEYPSEKIERYLKIIDAAIKDMTKKEENDSNDSIIADLRDKKKKWENVKKETKPVKTKLEVPPEQEEEPPPEEPPAKEPPPPNESRLIKYIIAEDYKTQKYFEKLLDDFKAGKITKKEMYKKMLHTAKKS